VPYRQRKTSVVTGQRAKDNICVRSLSAVRRVINCPSLSKRWLKASSAGLARRPAREINNEQCRWKVGLRSFLPIPHPLPLSPVHPANCNPDLRRLVICHDYVSAISTGNYNLMPRFPGREHEKSDFFHQSFHKQLR